MNRRRFQTLAALAALAGPAAAATPQTASGGAGALEVVSARMRHYNAHDLEPFMALYGQDVAIYDYPSKLLGQGKERQRAIFAPLFAEGVVRTQIHTQIVMGPCVINDETVNYADRPQRYVSIYEVTDGLITAVRFLR